MKMTKSRKLIYDVLNKSAMPLTAQEIYDLIKAQNQDIWLSTIYRNLEVFEEGQLVIKAEIPGSDQYHYILSDTGHHHFAICLSCKKIIDNLSCPMGGYEDELTSKGFRVVDHKFIIYGFCESCS